MIFGQDRRPMCERLEKSEEGVLTADGELSIIDFAKHVSLSISRCCRALFETGPLEYDGESRGGYASEIKKVEVRRLGDCKNLL